MDIVCAIGGEVKAKTCLMMYHTKNVRTIQSIVASVFLLYQDTCLKEIR